MRQEKSSAVARSQSLKKSSDKSEAQMKQLQKENKSLKTTNKVVLTTCALLATILAAKTIRSGHRLRNAQHDARAWRRVTMTMIEKGGDSSFRSLHQHGKLPSLLGHMKDEKRSLLDAKRIRNHATAIPRKESVEREDEAFKSATSSKHPSLSLSSEFSEAKESSTPTSTSSSPKLVPAMSSEWRKAVSHPMAWTASSSSNPIYSAVHPHEDWDWVPADHPPARTSWRKSRLPPWTVGFSSAPKSRVDLTNIRVSQSSMKDDETSDLEEHLLRSAIWPDSDPLKSSEAAFIVDEILKESSHKKQQQQTQQSIKLGTERARAQVKESESMGNKLNSTIWTESDTQKRNEAVLMADEIFKDLNNSKKHHSNQQTTGASKEDVKAKATLKPSPISNNEESEKVKALERQVWALLARSQALEDELRRKW